MFLLIDKPKGITSHDVVDFVRRVTGERRVGHGGTLDPNATGLLIVGVGRESTKKLSSFNKAMTKAYRAEVVLGETRDTYDIEGVVISKNNKIIPSLAQVSKVIFGFEGRQLQTPPSYSAVKVGGKKAYAVARKGKALKLAPREVVIYKINLLSYKYPRLSFECEVSSGTYIRSLAHDIGERLLCGAYLADLRRLAIGKYNISAATSLSELTAENYKKHTFNL